MQAGHEILQSGESRMDPSSTGSNSNLSKAWGPRPTSSVPALSESTHKPGVHANMYKPVEIGVESTFIIVFRID